ncbi:HAD-IA family hydrolase [Peribacillus psychrosaccharolyticus]|uniref:HAD-IA family hydrolase n=1 Tax=Peribacillus psychrosaccharolyticus TaxID=1407 RepID=A0A974NLK9_PERPY|nr:HAD-IA family hydrolase [Peribacillus psychrosaccharolyticus]MEC2054423.1 HAD-IA family hydrolase [Peribacillus psychrosaccharolyticus]MED3744349.1 HAD-IA family hydrolase [Peribacillus psychrosaccharolyticus]QQS99827.1 HAD-IA family hydrolase [Peribacillus psychrosaccharolyticus]
MYNHIIWDFDGTLFDTYPVMANVFREALKEQKIEEPVEEIIKQLRVSISTALKYYEEKYQITSEFISNYQKRRIEAELELSRPFDGIQEICKYIHSTNRKNYLFTHRGESSIILLKKYGLVDYFTDFITSKQGFERKPSPYAINYLLNKHNMIHSESIMIGDRELDLLSGKNAKISACYFTEGNDNNNYADYTINDFQQLYTII